MSTQTKTTHPDGRRQRIGSAAMRAFTLLEVLIAVMVIMVLVSIGVALGPAISGQGSEQLTRTALSSAETVLTEYRALTGRWPDITTTDTYWFNHVGLELEEQLLPVRDEVEFELYSGERFVARTLQTKVSRDRNWIELRKRSTINAVYENLDSEVFADSDDPDDDGYGYGFMDLRDGWGTKLVYVPAHQHQSLYWQNNVTWRFPARQTPYFVSAGPDGRFGNVYADEDTPEYEASLDNIYSFDVVNR